MGIEKVFHVYGVLGDEYEEFQKNVQYEALLITRIESQLLEEPTEIYMTSSQKKNKEIVRVYNDRTVDDPELVDVNNDPLVLKKMAAARKRWANTSFPSQKELLKLSDKFNTRS